MKNQIIHYVITIYLLKNKQISEYFRSVTCSDCSDTMKVRYSPGCWYFPFNGRLCNVEHSFEIAAGSCFGEIAILAGGNDRDKATITDNFRETSYATEKPLAINENDNPPFICLRETQIFHGFIRPESNVWICETNRQMQITNILLCIHIDRILEYYKNYSLDFYVTYSRKIGVDSTATFYE